jgi:signal transduction histidine kinase
MSGPSPSVGSPGTTPAAPAVVAELARARRERNTRAIAFGMGGFITAFTPVLALSGVPPVVVAVTAVCGPVLLALGFVARTRHAPAAAWALNLSLLAFLFAGVAVNRQLGPGPYLAGFVVLVAAATLGRAGMGIVGALSALDVLAMGFVARATPQQPAAPAVSVAYGLLICGITLGLAWMRFADILRMLTSVLEHERRALQAEERLWQAQKLGALGRLAGGVAHDFNNLLAVIKGCISTGPGDSAPGGEALRDAHHAIDRASALTAQLLTFAREQPIAARWFDPRPVLGDLARLLRRTLPPGIELRVELEEPLPWVHAAPAQIEQVVLNLVVNARDAMPRGGTVTLRGRTAGGRGPSRRLELTVSDTGTGISDEVRAHLFEPFFTTKPRGEGTGLGLATCYGIVRQLGGEIRVETAPGQGAAFTLELPGHDGPGPADAPRGPEDRAAAS